MGAVCELTNRQLGKDSDESSEGKAGRAWKRLKRMQPRMQIPCEARAQKVQYLRSRARTSSSAPLCRKMRERLKAASLSTPRPNAGALEAAVRLRL